MVYLRQMLYIASSRFADILQSCAVPFYDGLVVFGGIARRLQHQQFKKSSNAAQCIVIETAAL